MTVGAALSDVPPFRSAMVPSKDVDPGRDVEILKQEVEDYLKRLRDALITEADEIEERLAALEP